MGRFYRENMNFLLIFSIFQVIYCEDYKEFPGWSEQLDLQEENAVPRHQLQLLTLKYKRLSNRSRILHRRVYQLSNQVRHLKANNGAVRNEAADVRLIEQILDPLLESMLESDEQPEH